jgi:AraC family transcriptional regulator
MTPSMVPVSHGSPAFRASEVAGFRVVAASFPAGLRLPEHAHERATFAVVVEGGFEKHLVRGTQQCRPWTVIGEPAGERHANLFGPRGASVLILQPAPGNEPMLAPCRSFFDEPQHFRDAGVAALARRALDELARPDDLAPLALEALGLEMLVTAGRRATPSVVRGPQPWLRRLEEMIHARFTEPLRMRALAEAVDLHPVYVARAFRAQHGVTMATYVRQLRVAWAQERLRRPDTLICEVALAAGFSDQSHFTRAFTRVAGVSPSRWRRRVFGAG